MGSKLIIGIVVGFLLVGTFIFMNNNTEVTGSIIAADFVSDNENLRECKERVSTGIVCPRDRIGESQGKGGVQRAPIPECQGIA